MEWRISPLKKKKSPRLPSPHGQEQQTAQCPRKEQARLQCKMLSILGSLGKKKKKKNIVRHQREGLASLKIFAKADIQGAGVRVQRARVCFSEFRSRVVGSCHQPGGGESNLGPRVYQGWAESAIATANSFANVPGSAACGWRWGWGRVRRPQGPGSTTTLPPPNPRLEHPHPSSWRPPQYVLSFFFPKRLPC